MKEFLRNEVPLLTGLSDEEIELLARTAEERQFTAGSHIIRKGEPGDSAFILKEGAAETLLDKPVGAPFPLSKIGPGELFGELALFDGQPRSASVVASEPCRVIEIKRELFLQEIARNPETSLKLMSVVAKRLRRAESIVSDFSERIYGDVLPRLESAVAAQLDSAKVICEQSKERIDATTAEAGRVLEDAKGKWAQLKGIGYLAGSIFAVVMAVAGFFGVNKYDDLKEIVDVKVKSWDDSVKMQLQKVQDAKQEVEKLRTEATDLVAGIQKESSYLKVLKETSLAFEKMRRDLQLDHDTGTFPVGEQADEVSGDFFVAYDKLLNYYLAQADKWDSDILVEALDLVAETIKRGYVQLTKSDWNHVIDAMVQAVKNPPDHWRQQQRLNYLVERLHRKLSFDYAGGARMLVERMEGLLASQRPIVAGRTALILARLGSSHTLVKAALSKLQRDSSPWLRTQAAVARVGLGEGDAWDVLRQDLAKPYAEVEGMQAKPRGDLETAAFAAALMIAQNARNAQNPLAKSTTAEFFRIEELEEQLSSEKLWVSDNAWPAQMPEGIPLIETTILNRLEQEPSSWRNQFSWQYSCELICSLGCKTEQDPQGVELCNQCNDRYVQVFQPLDQITKPVADRCAGFR